MVTDCVSRRYAGNCTLSLHLILFSLRKKPQIWVVSVHTLSRQESKMKLNYSNPPRDGVDAAACLGTISTSMYKDFSVILSHVPSPLQGWMGARRVEEDAVDYDLHWCRGPWADRTPHGLPVLICYLLGIFLCEFSFCFPKEWHSAFSSSPFLGAHNTELSKILYATLPYVWYFLKAAGKSSPDLFLSKSWDGASLSSTTLQRCGRAPCREGISAHTTLYCKAEEAMWGRSQKQDLCTLLVPSRPCGHGCAWQEGEPCLQGLRMPWEGCCHAHGLPTLPLAALQTLWIFQMRSVEECVSPHICLVSHVCRAMPHRPLRSTPHLRVGNWKEAVRFQKQVIFY